MAKTNNPPQQTIECRARVNELLTTRPRDGRPVELRENRGGWKYTGLSGICECMSEDGTQLVLTVCHDPENYWTVGTQLLVNLDYETQPAFGRIAPVYKNLREQITEIGTATYGESIHDGLSWPRLVNVLAEKAFIEQWPEDTRTRAVRRAAKLLSSPGSVTADEPAIEDDGHTDDASRLRASLRNFATTVKAHCLSCKVEGVLGAQALLHYANTATEL